MGILRGQTLLFGWSPEMFTIRRGIGWIQAVLVAALVLMLRRGIQEYHPQAGGVALAVASTLCWVEMLCVLRAYRFFGEQLLPSLSAWREALSFLLVHFF